VPMTRRGGGKIAASTSASLGPEPPAGFDVWRRHAHSEGFVPRDEFVPRGDCLRMVLSQPVRPTVQELPLGRARPGEFTTLDPKIPQGLDRQKVEFAAASKMPFEIADGSLQKTGRIRKLTRTPVGCGDREGQTKRLRMVWSELVLIRAQGCRYAR
jgi:hypothetical protein